MDPPSPHKHNGCDTCTSGIGDSLLVEPSTASHSTNTADADAIITITGCSDASHQQNTNDTKAKNHQRMDQQSSDETLARFLQEAENTGCGLLLDDDNDEIMLWAAYNDSLADPKRAPASNAINGGDDDDVLFGEVILEDVESEAISIKNPSNFASRSTEEEAIRNSDIISVGATDPAPLEEDDRKPAARPSIANAPAMLVDNADQTASIESMEHIDDFAADNDLDLAIALSLQAQEELYGMMDVPKPMTSGDLKNDNYCDSDEQLAMAQAQVENEAAMESTFTGKAWRFVQTVMEEHKKLDAVVSTTGIQTEPIGTDDMLYMVERLAEAQQVFDIEQKDTRIDIGYHFTVNENLERIRTNGLLTKGEREAKGVANNYNGSAHGDGIYTANNPYAFRNYGDIGLLVARLKGDVKAPSAKPGGAFDGDTVLVHKGTNKAMVVLKQSYQCVPLLQFQSSSISSGDSSMKEIWAFHCMLQGVIDIFFHDGVQTLQPAVLPPKDWSGWLPPISYPVAPSLAMRLPQRSSPPPVEQPRKMNASPDQSDTYERDNGDHDDSSRETMRLMHYSKDVLACDTFDTFVIVYAFKSEEDAHQSVTHRIEYLPDTPASHGILTRLKHAFGDELISSVTYPLLPHRQSPYHPYPNHASIYNEALDSLGVPPTDNCGTGVAAVDGHHTKVE